MGHGARREEEAVGGSGRWRYRIEKDRQRVQDRIGVQRNRSLEEAEKSDESWRNNTEGTSGRL